MSSRIQPSVTALISGLTDALGPPSRNPDKVAIWLLGDFEVMVQKDAGPHVWLSSKWRPRGGVLAGFEIKRYQAGDSRHSALKATKTLSQAHSALCLKNVGSQVQAATRCVIACAMEAGAQVNLPDKSTADQLPS